MASAEVLGCYGYLPSKVISNADLCKTVDTSEDWIVSRTGILNRHIASVDEFTSDLALKAARGALQNADLNAVDMIIVATTTPDSTFPSTAVKVQRGLGIPGNIPAFDIQAVCSGFIYGLEVANCFILSKKYKTILLIGADKMSSIVDWSDRNTCVLFGDGAGAIVLGASKDSSGIIDTLIHADGEFYESLCTNGGPSSTGSTGKLYMEGKTVFRHAVTSMSCAIKNLLNKNGIEKSEIKYFIPHQANERITESVRKEVDLKQEQVISTVHLHANCSAGSIPLALDYSIKKNKIQKGDIVLFASFGGGFTWGAALLRW